MDQLVVSINTTVNNFVYTSRIKQKRTSIQRHKVMMNYSDLYKVSPVVWQNASKTTLNFLKQIDISLTLKDRKKERLYLAHLCGFGGRSTSNFQLSFTKLNKRFRKTPSFSQGSWKFTIISQALLQLSKKFSQRMTSVLNDILKQREITYSTIGDIS